MLSIYFCCFCKSEIMVKNTHVEHNCYSLMKVLSCCFANQKLYRHVASLVKAEGQKKTRNIPSLKGHC